MDAAGEDDEEEVGDVAALFALSPVVEVEAAAEELGEGAEEEDGRDEEVGGEGQDVCPHGRADADWPGGQRFE